MIPRDPDGKVRDRWGRILDDEEIRDLEQDERDRVEQRAREAAQDARAWKLHAKKRREALKAARDMGHSVARFSYDCSPYENANEMCGGCYAHLCVRVNKGDDGETLTAIMFGDAALTKPCPSPALRRPTQRNRKAAVAIARAAGRELLRAGRAFADSPAGDEQSAALRALEKAAIAYRDAFTGQ